MFSLTCAWTNSSGNNGNAGDLRHHRAHYGVTVMRGTIQCPVIAPNGTPFMSQALNQRHPYISQKWIITPFFIKKFSWNKANLRDLIATTGLVILLKLDTNRRFFSPCDLEIWWMTPKNNRAPLLCYFKLCALSRSHWEIETGVTVRKRPIWVKIDDFFSCVTLQFDVWPWKTMVHLFYATSSFVHHFVAIGEFKLELQSGNAQFGTNSMIFGAMWPWNLTYDLEKQ